MMSQGGEYGFDVGVALLIGVAYIEKRRVCDCLLPSRVDWNVLCR